MQTRIREVRKAKGLTLAEVASRCSPPTTAQTIGRLETGTRTVSVGWLNRIADALQVDPSELVRLPDRPDVPVAAILGAAGVERPRRPMVLTVPRVRPDLIGMTVEVAQGEYRAGDELWLTRLEPQDYTRAINKDVLVPLPPESHGTSLDTGSGMSPARVTANLPGNASGNSPANITGHSPGTIPGNAPGTIPGTVFVFGRLMSVTPGATETPGTLQVLPLSWGSQPVTLHLPEWVAVVSALLRKL